MIEIVNDAQIKTSYDALQRQDEMTGSLTLLRPDSPSLEPESVEITIWDQEAEQERRDAMIKQILEGLEQQEKMKQKNSILQNKLGEYFKRKKVAYC